MTVLINKKLSKTEIAKLFDKRNCRIKPLDVSKYEGKFGWHGDALKLQKKWRNS